MKKLEQLPQVAHRITALDPFSRESIPPLDELRGSYRVRFARSTADLEGCFRLRYEVFNLELGEGLVECEATGLDTDRFDAHCDHLMVVEESSGEVIGTYRMQTFGAAQAGQGFYSAGEYNLAGLTQPVLSQSVELGRAAIAATHRDKSVLYLLWRGLTSYYRWNDARYFFGCSSLTSQDPEEGLRCQDWLARKGYLHRSLWAAALPGYVCESDGHETFEGDFAIPRLFGFYLRFCAKVCSPPAIDREFGTIDFITLTDTRSIAGKLAEAFARDLPKRG